jgi:hypothetical protein
MNEKRGLPTFQEAVRAIATTQVSSAAVERVFSQLTFIRPGHGRFGNSRGVGDKGICPLQQQNGGRFHC